MWNSQVRIDPSTPVHGKEEVRAAQNAAKTWWNVEGEPTKKFEKKLGEMMGMKYVELVNSGSSANLAALMALTTNYITEDRRITPGDEVITTALSFPTTVSPIIYAGAKPVFVDVERNTWNISPIQIEEMITSRTKAIMVAHALGNPFNVAELKRICKEHNLWLIEDNCFVGDTLVKTINGDKKIKDIVVGDMVLTRKGYRKVLVSVMTGKKQVIDKIGLRATPEHPVITKDGVKRLDALSVSDIIYQWNEKLSSIEEKSLLDIQVQQERILGSTTGVGVLKREHHYTEQYGKTVMGIFQKIMMYITGTRIPSITNYQISNSYLGQNITQSILENQTILKRSVRISNLQEREQKYGMEVQQELNGTRSMEKNAGLIERLLQKIANIVGLSINHSSQQGQSTVQKSVKNEVEFVYNLKVQGCHEFFANGILVHNCDCLGGEFEGRKTGGFGDIATQSFYPAHHISTGEGGAVMTNNSQINRGLNSIINWGRDCYCAPGCDNTCGARYNQQHGDLPKGYDHKNTYTEFGQNLKMSQIQAAIGVEQLKRLPGFIKDRRYNHAFLESVFEPYAEWFEKTIPYEGATMSPFGYVVKLSEKAPFTKQEFEQYLDKEGIKSRAFFCGNITRQPVLTKNDRYDYAEHEDLSVSNDIMENSFWIGVHPGIKEKERLYMEKKITEFLSRYK